MRIEKGELGRCLTCDSAAHPTSTMCTLDPVVSNVAKILTVL